ncbi:MAG: histidine acid phosphatase [Fibrobacter sp.]|nr:histidine acid phosphatase [Fibrobacter sp.]
MRHIINTIAPATCAIAIAFGALSAQAQTTDAELAAHPEYTLSGAMPYPEPGKNVKYTKAPAGYKPFYISHYGRHGSRYHHSADEYKYIAETLAKADSANALTPLGKQVNALAQTLKSEAMPRTGDLTQAGVHQHMGIAKRMAKNFPEVFKDRKAGNKKAAPHVKAYASTSGRCIVSMAAFVGELRVQFPKIEPELVSGKSYMPFICAFDWGKLDYSKAPAYTAESDKLWQNVDPKPLLQKLFADTAYAAKNIDAGTFYNRLLEITDLFPGMDSALVASVEKAANAPVSTLREIYTPEERVTRWKAQNAWWYSLLGTSPLINKSNGTDFAKGTLQNILDEADTVLAGDAKSVPVAATLRFGHDAGLLPLAALMQLPVANAKVADLSKLHEQWTDFRVIPMAANLQIVFYRKGDASPTPTKAASPAPAKAGATSGATPGANVLVKVLYNEIEQILPVPCGNEPATNATAAPDAGKPTKQKCPAAPYYRWEDFRDFYSKLAK